MKDINKELAPAIFAVKNDYHIMMYPSAQCLMWVKVGDKTYYDENNGILRSVTTVHRVIVPMEELDKAKKYTLCIRYVIDRKPYFPELEDLQEKEFEFRPVTDKKGIRAYNISDTHNWPEGAIAAANHAGDIDFLILSGDIPDYNSEPERCITIYELAGNIAKGNIPTVFVKGNHDLRGLYAEKYFECTPTDNTRSYYTFKIGNIWGMVLDCGEDKLDSHEEYGGTVCCHDFRLRQTEYFRQVVESKEYLAPDIKHRLVLCHVPFTFKWEEPFDIEDDIYNEWTKLINQINPKMFLCGHTHKAEVVYPEDEKNYRKVGCPTVVGSLVRYKEYFAGALIEFNDDKIDIVFNDMYDEIVGKATL